MAFVAIFGLFALGLLVGGVTSYFFTITGNSPSERITVTTTAIGTSSFTVTEVQESYTTVNFTYSPNYTELASALKYSPDARLNITYYTFFSSGRVQNELIVQFENIGNHSIILTPHDCLLNHTFFNSTALQPASQALIFGPYVFLYPGWSALVAITLPSTPALRDNSTLQIYNNTWTFMWGTSKT